MKIRFVSLVSGWLAISALAVSGAVGYSSFYEMVDDDNFTPLPVERVTDGPSIHWKAYYDVPKIDPTGRYLLGMQSDFENRSPVPEDVIQIGIIDLQDNNQWTTIGTSRAWCWQQGCRLQWRGQNSGLEVVWNDREDDQFVTRVYNTQTQQTRTLPRATYDISSDGQWAFGLNFARTDDMRQGYGYEGVADPNEDQLAPSDDGIYRMDLDTGESEMLFSIHDIALLHDGDEITRKIYFNHIECAPGDQRFFFLSLGDRKGYAFSANFDGSDIRCIAAGGTSHYNWRDANSTLIFMGGMYGNYTLFNDDASRSGEVVLSAQNGHHTYLPGDEWLLTDTYPQSADNRFQWIYLYHVPSGGCVPIGKFYSPPAYDGEWRCDLHPYLSPDGRTVVFDSTHEGLGRQLYKVDISSLTNVPPTITPRTLFKIDAPLRHSTWDFEEGGGLLAVDTLGNNDLALPDSSADPGAGAYSMFFDGVDDYLTTAAGAPDLNPGTNDFTISFKVKVAASKRMFILNKRNPEGGEWIAVEQTSDGQLLFAARDDGINVSVRSKDQLPVGQWVHVDITAERGLPIQIFFDGVDQTDEVVAIHDQYLGNAAPLEIGRWSGDGYYFEGLIDDLSIKIGHK